MHVSAVIPTFGRSDSLRNLLSALGEQTVPLHEVVVVDQNAAGWLDSQLGSTAKGVRIIHCDEANVSTARNVGALSTVSEILLFIDDDLVPSPSFVGEALQRLASNPDVGCLCPVIASRPNPRDRMMRWLRKRRLTQHPRDAALWSVSDTISATMLFRRGTFLDSGGFDELLFSYARSGEDLELCMRMRARGMDIWIDSSLTIFHDESVPGGCGLRVQEYWDRRRWMTKALSLCARLHNAGKLSVADIARLARSSFLNSMMLQHSPGWAIRNGRLLVDAIADSSRFLTDHQIVVGDVRATDYLAKHHGRKENAAAWSNPRIDT